MSNTSLLVHTLNNNVENIEVLLEEDNLDKDAKNLIGKIIDNQLNKILENAELYYLEDEKFAINKDKVLYLEFINYIRNLLLNNINKKINVKMFYKNKKINIDIELLRKILKYLLLVNYNDIDDVKIELIDDEINVEIIFEKNKEHSLQN